MLLDCSNGQPTVRHCPPLPNFLKAQRPTKTELDAGVATLTMRLRVGTSTCANFMFPPKGGDPSGTMASLLLDRLNGPRPYYMRGGEKDLSGNCTIDNDLAGMLAMQ